MTTKSHDFNEPRVEELLQDPVLLAVLDRDGLTIDDVKAVIAKYQDFEEKQIAEH